MRGKLARRREQLSVWGLGREKAAGPGAGASRPGGGGSPRAGRGRPARTWAPGVGVSFLRVTGGDSACGLRCLFHFLFWSQFSNIHKSRENDTVTHHVTQTQLLCFCASLHLPVLFHPFLRAHCEHCSTLKQI